MVTPIIYNDVDFEENVYDFFRYLMYKGEPFTGTLVDGNWTISFKNGNAHGRSVDYYDNGNMACDCIYEDGHFKEGRYWYFNGQLKSENTASAHYQWDSDGTLACDNGTWLYKSGVVREKNISGGCEYYAASGALAISVTYVHDGDYKNLVKYYDDALYSGYHELLINLYPDLDNFFSSTELYFWGWVWEQLAKDREKGGQVLHTLTTHPNQSVRENALKISAEIRNSADVMRSSDYHGYHIIG